MKFYKIKFVIVGFIIIPIWPVWAQTDFRSLEYSRQTLFETKPWVAPYYLPLQYGQDDYHFSHKKNGRIISHENKKDTTSTPLAPRVDYFWALNSGELVFIDKNEGLMKSGSIAVFEYQDKQWKDYLICGNYHDYFSNIWANPNDEIYFNYYSLKEPANPDGSRFHLKKYDLSGSRWIDAPRYKQINLEGPSTIIRIAPIGNIYLRTGNIHSSTLSFISSVFDSCGNYIDTTASESITIDSIPVSFSTLKKGDSDIHTVYDLDRNGLLHQKLGSLTDDNYEFKATFDSLIIIHTHWIKDQKTENGFYFATDLPLVMVLDPSRGLSKEISLTEKANYKYKYYNVSDIDVNYKGDIYAMFVYFNDPYQITGDELIVLYRWTRI